jgi:hypothetical protein
MGLFFPFLVLLALVILVGLVVSANKPDRKSGRQPYFKNAKGSDDFFAPLPETSGYELVGSVLTPAEVAFARVLFQVDMPEYVIFSKVRVADFVNVRKGQGDEGKKAFWRIAQKHVDFLIVGRSDFRPVLAIELDDSSHDQFDRMRRDDFVNAIYRDVGLPILHVPAKAWYSPVDLAAQMERLVFQPKFKEGTGSRVAGVQAFSWQELGFPPSN